MARVKFDELPNTARVWTFGVQRPLAEDEEVRLLEQVDAFLEDWASHGTPLKGARDWRHGRLLIVGVDAAAAPPSGCSIDALVHALKDLETRFETGIVDNSRVWFMEDGEVRCESRPGFRELAESGQVTPETTVFDTSVTKMDDVRSGAWELPARRCWHQRAFFSS